MSFLMSCSLQNIERFYIHRYETNGRTGVLGSGIQTICQLPETSTDSSKNVLNITVKQAIIPTTAEIESFPR